MDTLRDAARPDLADIRLADRVFAPHYAAALQRRVEATVELRTSGGERLVQLKPGEMFEVLELSGGNAWGIAVTPALVGYVDASALGW